MANNNRRLHEGLVREFVAHLHAIGRAESTIANARCHLSTYFEHLNTRGNGSCLRPDAQDIGIYQEHLNNTDYTPATVTAKLCTLKGFYRYLVRTERLQIDPTRQICLPKKTVVLPRTVLSKRQAGRLMRTPDIRTDSGKRDRAILECLYSTGLRAQELCDLTVETVDIGAGLLYVKGGKGRKDRAVPMGPTASDWIRLYRDTVRPRYAHSDQERSIFVGMRHGRGISTVTLRQVVHRHAVASRTRKHVTPHVLRHSCATHLVASGADIRYVQELLGHELLETTQIYVRVSINDVRRMHRLYHPREHDEY